MTPLGLHIRYPAYKIFYIAIPNSNKITENSNENNFMVEGHHNMRIRKVRTTALAREWDSVH